MLSLVKKEKTLQEDAAYFPWGPWQLPQHEHMCPQFENLGAG